MPTYQYVCTECHHGFEQFQTFSEDSLTVCPECGGRLRKVFNAVGVVFKGSGFYKTDSRKEKGSAAPAAKSGDSSSSSSSSSSSPSTDSSNGTAASNGASNGGKSSESEASKAGSAA